METIFIGDEEFYLFRAAPDWSQGVRISHALKTVVAEGQTGRQSRRPVIEAARFRMTAAWLLKRSGISAIKEILGDERHLRWALPLWPALANNRSAYDAAIYTAAYTLNFDSNGYEVFQTSLIPEALNHKWLVPLIFGRPAKRPELEARGAKAASFALELEEDSPFAMRVAVNPVEIGESWPSSLKPNGTRIVDLSSDRLDLTEMGNIRERQVDGEDAPPRWGQDAEFTFAKANGFQVRTLLSFFTACVGRVKSFAQPFWFVNAPGYGTQDSEEETDESVTVNPMVGFASDEVELLYYTNGAAKAQLRFWQRPHEENGGIDGEVPEQPATAFLLDFEYRIPTSLHYRFTDYEKPLQLDATRVFEPRPFELSDPTWSFIVDKSTMQLKSYRFAGNPLQKFLPFNLEGQLGITIYSCDPSDPPATAEIVWKGTVENVSASGKVLTAKCLAFGGMMDRRLPRPLLQPGCNWNVFDRNCRADQVRYRRTSTIAGIDGTALTIAGISEASGWLTGGYLETGSGEGFERRQILAHNGSTLSLLKPLRHATVGQSLTLWPGCDGEFATCKSKFDNAINFGGFKDMPAKNPTVQAIDTDQNIRKK